MGESSKFNWAHFMALGMLVKAEGPVKEKEFKECAPEVRQAVLDFQTKGFAKWIEYMTGNVPQYALTEEGRKYAQKVMRYASEQMTTISIEEGI